MTLNPSILIVGAGPTGLGAAYRLWQCGASNWRLIEGTEHPGGLASSFTDASGFVWDVGGHVQFSHYEEYDRVVEFALGAERVWHNRRALVRIGDGYVPYPLQNNLHRLDAATRQMLLQDLVPATSMDPAAPRDRTFRGWIEQTFGHGLGRLFMVPYNEKVWGFPLELLSSDWVAERIPVPDPVRMRSALATNVGDDVNWGPNKQFSYPLHGGTGSTWRKIASLFSDRCDYRERVVAVNLSKRRLRLSSGRELTWDVLISSVPLDAFCALCEDITNDTLTASRRLLHSACHVVGIGLRGHVPADLSDTTWMYFPGASAYYRVTVLSNYSPNNAPSGCWSLMAEVCETRFRPLPDGDLFDRVVADLRTDRLIPSDVDIISRWRYSAEYGYPTPSVDRDDILRRIMPELEAHGVYSRGRFGGWKYEVSNQDHCFMQGVEVVDRILAINEETVYDIRERDAGHQASR
jgi:protoporphyrinogen oxidase